MWQLPPHLQVPGWDVAMRDNKPDLVNLYFKKVTSYGAANWGRGGKSSGQPGGGRLREWCCERPAPPKALAEGFALWDLSWD